MTLERLAQCPLCGSQNLKLFLACKDYTVTNELFHVERCENCQFIFTNPRPIKAEAFKYYQSKNYISHSSKSSGLFDRIYLTIRSFSIKWKFKLIQPYLTNKHLLDIGCGTGSFASFCHSRGYSVFGVEPSKEARSEATNKSIKVFETLEELPDVKFSVITLWHVLEHIYDLETTLKKIKELLTDDGIVFIAVPNYESYDANQYKEYWAAYDVPRHLWHFTKKSMDSWLTKTGLTVTNKVPMKLDAYYVSMLSEKYQSGSKLSLAGILRSVSTGFRSNKSARSTMNYSSIIYQIKK